MRPRQWAAAAAIAAAVLAPAGASAAPVVANQWYEFQFGTVGTLVFQCATCVPSSAGNTVFAPAPPWTFTGAAPFSFTITDAFLRQSRFTLFDGGALVGSTPAPSGVGTCGDDPAVCVLDPGVSHATFLMAAGDHAFTIRNDGTSSDGAAYFRIDATVTPEPATVTLLLVGLLAVPLLRRQSRR